jgi:guanosine-3',5'-bis(diphosphate) 3'-pyrophosphohydrolase
MKIKAAWLPGAILRSGAPPQQAASTARTGICILEGQLASVQRIVNCFHSAAFICIERTMTPPTTQTILRAAAFAAHKHRDQRRKDAAASPYINHPIALANILANEGGILDAVVLAAALLHDTLEDTETTPEELQALFGTEITSVVVEVSDDKSLPKAERKQLQVEHAAHISERAKLVKLADKIANIRDVADAPPAGWSLERRREYFDWAKQVVDGLGDISPALRSAFDAAYASRP